MSAKSAIAENSAASAPRIGGIKGFWKLLLRFLPFALPYWDKLLLRILYKQATAMIGVLGATATIRMVDDGLLAGNTQAFMTWSMIKVVLTAHIFIHITIYANIFHFVLMRLNLAFKRHIFNHVQKMTLAFHQKRPIGENMYRINNDTEFATDFGANSMPELVERLVELLTYAGLLFALNPTILGLLLVYVGFYFIFSHVIVSQMYRAQQFMRRAEQRVAALLQEVYSAFGISKAFSRGRHDRRRYFHRLADLMRERLRFFGWLAAWMEGAELLREIVISQLSHILICGVLVIKGYMSLGEFIAVIEMINLVQGPLMAVVATIQRLRVAAVPAQRLLETLDMEPDVQDKPNAISLEKPKGEIAFDHVWFRYQPDGPDVIQDLSFQVPAGSKTAIVGVSGAGKTSIFNLLMRFSDPTQGRVLIDGKDLRDLKLQSYLDQVSVVLQENFLFSATIGDNIRVGNPKAKDGQLKEAIKRSGLQPTIDAMPQGLDTMLLEGGNLSMGQKQRVGIARAVIRDPRFLYLDEATSSLDPVTEEEILEQLKEVEKDRTVLVIAHHIASVREADQILVMEKGHLVQQGRHDDLIADRQGAYYRLWNAEKAKRLGDVDGEDLS